MLETTGSTRRKAVIEEEPNYKELYEKAIGDIQTLDERFSSLSERFAKLESKQATVLPRSKIEEVLIQIFGGATVDDKLRTSLMTFFRSQIGSANFREEIATSIRGTAATMVPQLIQERVNATPLSASMIRDMDAVVKKNIREILSRIHTVFDFRNIPA